ncbi:MAG: hypothetical protein MMC33_007591 [Icmadophila ericetorum]|nr:hypothetical protein [Icmadophila ericetorum]
MYCSRTVLLARFLTIFLLSATTTLATSPVPPTTTAPPSLQARVSIPPVSITPITIRPHTPYVPIHPTHTQISLDLHLPTPTCIQTIVPDKNGFVPPGTCSALYEFYPSFGAALLFSILFGALTIAHIAQAVHYKKGFCWVIIVGSLWETGSFVFRTLSTRDQQSIGLALISQLLVLLAPLWVNAFDYMILGRMIYYFLPSHAIFGIKASTLAIYFVSLDFVSFVIQLVGGAQAGPNSPPAVILKAVHIYMGGIGLQEFFIVVFMGLAIKFHVEILALEKRGMLAGSGKQNWRRLLFTLYASLMLITIRILFRLLEFSSGKTSGANPLVSHEAYFYVFDAVPMFFALLTVNATHPGKVLVGTDSILPRSTCCGLRKNQGKGGDMGGTDGKGRVEMEVWKV